MGRQNAIMSLDLRPVTDSAAGPAAEPQWEVGACTDVGRVRGNNEDSFCTAPGLNLYVLSDGMGGMACGEVASRLTVETVLGYCRDAEANPSQELAGKRIEGISEASNRLVSGIRLANEIVHRAALEGANHQKMGATVVAVFLADGCMSVAHVGDSRAYRLRGDHLEQLTQDHTYIAGLSLDPGNEAQFGCNSLHHLLTRAVGVEPEVEVDVLDELVMEGDIVLLCSDGLTREVTDREIGWVLRDSRHAQEAADQLVTLANDAGGGDNITAIVLRHAPKESGASGNLTRFGRWLSGRGN
ncbi:MAG TPA: protein phosphatase 2C domain-containing protein [Bryobacteraceae bacterium]|nr:protein phosphatase 2C domain-containing protein [Bryobacteraceae bacterium]